MPPYLLRLHARVGTALESRGVSPPLVGQHLVRYLAADLAGLHLAADVLVHVTATCCNRQDFNCVENMSANCNAICNAINITIVTLKKYLKSENILYKDVTKKDYQSTGKLKIRS